MREQCDVAAWKCHAGFCSFNRIRMSQLSRTLPPLSNCHILSLMVSSLSTSFLEGCTQTGAWSESKDEGVGGWNLVLWGRTWVIWPEENSGRQKSFSWENVKHLMEFMVMKEGNVVWKIRHHEMVRMHEFSSQENQGLGRRPFCRRLLATKSCCSAPLGTSGHQGSHPCNSTLSSSIPSTAIWAMCGAKNIDVFPAPPSWGSPSHPNQSPGGPWSH